MAKKPSLSRKSKELKPPPQCKSILLCDLAIIDAITGNISVIGIFNTFQVSKLPGSSRDCTVFLQLINGIGRYGINVEVHDLRKDVILARANLQNIEFQDRKKIANVIIPVPQLPISHGGAYDLVVFAEGQEIDRQQFHVQSGGGQEHADDETKEDHPESE